MSNHDSFYNTVKERKSSEIDWFKACLTSTSALLGILIALDNNTDLSCWATYFYISTIISLSICTLVGLLFLYGETDTKHLLVNKYLELTNNLELEAPEKIIAKPRKIFDVLRILFFCFFFISFLSLILYGVFLKI